MTRSVAFTGVFITALVTAFAAVAIAGHVSAQPSRVDLGLTVFAKPDAEAYAMSDTALIDVGLRNDSQEDVFVFHDIYDISFSFSEGLIFHVQEVGGKEIRPSVISHVPPVPIKDGDDSSLFVRLKPDHFYGIRESIALRELARPGRYQITVEYVSPALRPMFSARLKGLRTLWHSDGGIMAKPFQIDVR
jgi:hypothetical protein